MTDQLDPTVDTSVLDNPVWSSLTGTHAHLARTVGGAARYPSDVAVFGGLSDDTDPAAWADLARVLDPGQEMVGVGVDAVVPAGWEVERSLPGVQLVGIDEWGEPDPEAVRLGAADVPEMVDLVRRTEPGPFLERTIELGTYLGVRRDGALVAMAGERLRPAGWTEISAVCTDPAYRGQGLATRLTRAIVVGVRERGEIPFLHAAAANATAIRVYESIGFTLRRTMSFRRLRPVG